MPREHWLLWTFPATFCCARVKLRQRTLFLLLLLPALLLLLWPVWTAQPPCTLASCSCETCVTDQGLSAWFDQRFNSTVQPLLTNDNTNISTDILLWWLKLQMKAPAVSLAHEQLFQQAPKSRLDPRNNCRCHTCAVVGNSGNLVSSSYGQLIDSHRFVFRMNQAVTEGYEADVGRKTTHHLMYPESARSLEPGVRPVLVPFKPRDLQWMQPGTRARRALRVDWDKALTFHPAFMKYVHDAWTQGHGRYPSTGLLALVLALHLCDQVSVMGYGSDGRGDWHHYWERNRLAGAFRFTGVHDATFEAAVIRRLAAGGKVRLYRGRL